MSIENLESNNNKILFYGFIEKIRKMPEKEKELFNLKNLEKNKGEHLSIMLNRLENSFDKIKYELELKYDGKLSNEEVEAEKDKILKWISESKKSIGIVYNIVLFKSFFSNYNGKREVVVGLKDSDKFSNEIKNIVSCHENGHGLRDDLYNIDYNNNLYKEIISPFYLKNIDFNKIWNEYMGLVKQITIDNGEWISKELDGLSEKVKKNLNKKMINIYDEEGEYLKKFWKIEGKIHIQNSLSYWLDSLEIVERMAQIKNFFGMDANDIFTKRHLDYFKENYYKIFKNENDREFIKIQMSYVINLISDENEFIENMNKMWI